mmetsp:Transcript_23780/g.67316  ORF Transcript_23780/g.67316 Transcript_23780/m.67316 type:complete len:288 (-) Transcript_23780:72-935(-)
MSHGAPTAAASLEPSPPAPLGAAAPPPALAGRGARSRLPAWPPAWCFGGDPWEGAEELAELGLLEWQEDVLRLQASRRGPAPRPRPSAEASVLSGRGQGRGGGRGRGGGGERSRGDEEDEEQALLRDFRMLAQPCVAVAAAPPSVLAAPPLTSGAASDCRAAAGCSAGATVGIAAGSVPGSRGSIDSIGSLSTAASSRRGGSVAAGGGGGGGSPGGSPPASSQAWPRAPQQGSLLEVLPLPPPQHWQGPQAARRFEGVAKEGEGGQATEADNSPGGWGEDFELVRYS